MNELIKITERNGQQLVSARDLHAFLEVKKEFATWIKSQIAWFTEGVDYEAVSLKVAAGAGSTEKTDYAITLDTAKEMAMMSKVKKGKEARQYFINCEKALKEVVHKTMSTEEMIIAQAQSVMEVKKDVKLLSDKVRAIEAKTITCPTDYFTIAGYASLNGKNVDVKVASAIGKKAKSICNDLGYVTGQIPDPRFGRVNTYPTEVLKTAFDQYYTK